MENEVETTEPVIDQSTDRDTAVRTGHSWLLLVVASVALGIIILTLTWYVADQSDPATLPAEPEPIENAQPEAQPEASPDESSDIIDIRRDLPTRAGSTTARTSPVPVTATSSGPARRATAELEANANGQSRTTPEFTTDTTQGAIQFGEVRVEPAPANQIVSTAEAVVVAVDPATGKLRLNINQQAWTGTLAADVEISARGTVLPASAISQNDIVELVGISDATSKQFFVYELVVTGEQADVPIIAESR